MMRPLLIAACVTLSGCATLAHDSPKADGGSSRQVVQLTSEPSEARVYIGSTLVGTTPTRVVLERRETNHRLRFEKDGHHPKEVALARTTSGAVAGNLGFAIFAATPNNGLSDRRIGGRERVALATLLPLGGIVIDFVTGSAYNLPPSVHATLQPQTRPVMQAGSTFRIRR
jgi:hypothetical protein